ncbi:MAG: S-adenosylmethionine synthetase [Nitrososphaerota archaeon]
MESYAKDFIALERLHSPPVWERHIEIVERKGKGHPDTLIDCLAEDASLALANYYYKTYGRLLHYNLDKGIIVGGRSAPRFGGGEVLEPIYILLAGRATSSVAVEGRQEFIPVVPLVLGEARRSLSRLLRFLDPDRHVVVDCKVKQGSGELIKLVGEGKLGAGPGVLANDSSLGVGFAPLSPLEGLVLNVERHLNSEAYKRVHPEVGEDVKVIAVRRGDQVELTVAAAMISHLVKDRAHYRRIKQEVAEEVQQLAQGLLPQGYSLKVNINAADREEEGYCYITVTGTSAEMGDDGNTGRGNKANGLITPMREQSMEAVAGKNALNHSGKLFNLLAQRMAEEVCQISGIREAYVRLVSKIGHPLKRPLLASVGLVLEPSVTLASVSERVENAVLAKLEELPLLTQELLSGRLRAVC